MRSLLSSGLALCGCVLALSACNTTGDGKPAKTALISPASQARNTTQNVAAAPAATATNVAAAQPGAAAPVAGQAANPADVKMAYAAQPGVQGPTLAAASAIAAAGPETADQQPDPVLPAIVPIPGLRGQSEPTMAFAGAKAAASPASLAANMAFETPASAPHDLDALIQKYSVAYEVPERLVRRVVHRESRFNPAARNGPYWGLMQITHATARGMGYTGGPKGLLDAETNLKYAVKYLAGAYRVASGNETQAVRYYARGYYYDAKRKGLLVETGLKAGPTREAAASIQPVSLPAHGGVPVPTAAPAFAQAQPTQ